MNNTLLVIGGLALLAVAYYGYIRREAHKKTKEELINNIVEEFNAEEVDMLKLSDAVNYFKSMSLKKGVDVPFIATTTKDGVKSYLLAIYNEDMNEIKNGKLISPSSIDDELKRVIGNEAFIVLS